MIDALTPVHIAIAFAAGMVSFVSPCMLPLVPGYLAFLAGPTSASANETSRSPSRQMRQALLFVSAFTVVFVAMGMGASLLGGQIVQARRGIEVAAGVMIALMGLVMLAEPVAPLALKRRLGPRLPTVSSGRPIDAIVLGVAFAAAWSPCLGPALAAILALAASSQQAASGGVLLLVYALGLGVPFIAVAAAAQRALPLLHRFRPHLRLIQGVSGAVLLAFGIAVASGAMGQLSSRLSGVGGLVI